MGSFLLVLSVLKLSHCPDVFSDQEVSLWPFFIQGLHVITCEMWLKPRGVALMAREAPEHTVSISVLWLRGMYLF